MLMRLLSICWQIVEFIAVLLRTNREAARSQLVHDKAIEIVLNLFFK